MNNVLAPSERDDGFPKPRQFQIDAHNALRRGFKEGHKNQLIMAPTGAGKTYLGLRVCYEAMQKGKRAVFLCDRTTLIDQTSAVADRYGLTDHGVIQANHWRRRLMSCFRLHPCRQSPKERSGPSWMCWWSMRLTQPTRRGQSLPKRLERW